MERDRARRHRATETSPAGIIVVGNFCAFATGIGQSAAIYSEVMKGNSNAACLLPV
jgi:hypothetical protein